MTEAMYQQYFGLTDAPFSITPDPRFVYLSPRHEDALAHLRYGIGQGGGGGFVQLTGEVGTGKTTLCRLLLEDLPEDTRIALILNPRLEPLELLEAICDELKISTRGAKGSQKRLVDKLNQYLLDAHGKGLTVVLMVDEAQNLSRDALEQVRLLTNLETATQKLLQIVLLGQPELRDLLARSDLRQLAQRITARYHLVPLDAAESAAYVAHRMQVGGATRLPFSRSGLRALYRQSGGVPRLINIIAERSLLAAYARDRQRIDASIVRVAAKEVLGEEGRGRSRLPLAAGIAAAAALLAGALWWFGPRAPEPGVAVVETVPQPTSNEMANEPTPEPVAATQQESDDPAGDDPAQSVERAMPAPPTESVIEPPITEPPEALPVEAFDTTWTRLFALRGLGTAPAAQSGACALELAPALFCLESRGAIHHIIQLGRPVVVQLRGDASGFAVFEANDAGLWLHQSDRPREVDRDQFERQWNGRYWDVWQMPGYVPTLLREGDRGPGVLWIKAAAALADPPYRMTVDDPYFGPSLKLWVQDFQEQSGLRADGLIGPETLQVLSRYALEVPG